MGQWSSTLPLACLHFMQRSRVSHSETFWRLSVCVSLSFFYLSLAGSLSLAPFSFMAKEMESLCRIRVIIAYESFYPVFQHCACLFIASSDQVVKGLAWLGANSLIDVGWNLQKFITLFITNILWRCRVKRQDADFQQDTIMKMN